MLSKDDKYIITIFFFISLSLQLIVLDSHPISISVDSFSYIKSNASMRPHGYDLYLLLTGIKIFDSILLSILLQLFFVSLVPVILFLSFKKFNRYAAILVPIIFFFYTYPYVMSSQIMSESIFIFGCSLIIFFLINYSTNQSTKNLILLLTCLFITNEIRQSLILLYPAIILSILAIYFGNNSRIILKHLVATLLVAIMHISFGSLSIKLDYKSAGPIPDKTIKIPFINFHFNPHKNSRNMAPFFAIHSMSSLKFIDWEKKGILGQKYFLNPSNGINSKIFYEKIRELLSDKNFFYNMASNRSIVGTKTNIRTDFLDHNNQTISKLADDIFYNRQLTPHRWPQLAQHMYNIYGYKETGHLLRGLIFEAIQKNYKLFGKSHLANLYGNLLVSSFHDELFYYFIPDEYDFNNYAELLNLFPLSSSAYSSWLYQMDAVVGNDNYKLNGLNPVNDWPYRNDYFYRIPSFKDIFLPFIKISESQSIMAYHLHGNKFALPNYVLSSTNRAFIIISFIIMPILIFLTFFSKMRILSLSILISGILIMNLSCLISTGPRQICMFMIFFAPLYATAIDGFNRIFKKIKF